MKKFILKKSWLGKKFMSNVGVFVFDNSTTQKDLKKIYAAGYKNIVEVVEKKDEAEKED